MLPYGALCRSQTYKGHLEAVVHQSLVAGWRASSLLSLPSSKHLHVCSQNCRSKSFRKYAYDSSSPRFISSIKAPAAWTHAASCPSEG